MTERNYEDARAVGTSEVLVLIEWYCGRVVLFYYSTSLNEVTGIVRDRVAKGND
jgi:hypothetical protein